LITGQKVPLTVPKPFGSWQPTAAPAVAHVCRARAPTPPPPSSPPAPQPYCSAHWAAAAERDAGYLLFSALCAGGAAPDVLVGLSQASLKRGAGGDAMALLRVALGLGAREALDERT
jgi:hypothetical protein